MNRFLRFIPAAAWAATIFFLSSQSRLPRVGFDFVGKDKLVHACAFAVLTALLLWGDQLPRTRRAWLWAGLASLYGATDELHQLMTPGRSTDVLDWLADTLGAALCVWAWLTLARRWDGRVDRAGGAPRGRPI